MPADEVLDLEAPETPGVSKEQKPETVTISKANYARMQRETSEARESERFWADRARGGGKSEPQAEEDEPIETSDLLPKPAKVTGTAEVDDAIFSDPDKWLEAISKGPKAIQALVKKATEGYVNAEQVAEIAAKVAQRTVQVNNGKTATDNRLMKEFPELADNKSELFRATAEEYQELVQFDPSAKKSPATLFAAARAAKIRLDAAAAPKARKGEDEDEDGPYDRVESARRQRVDAQDGRRRGSTGDEPSDSLGPQARAIAKMMGVSDAEFIAEKKKTDAGRRR